MPRSHHPIRPAPRRRSSIESLETRLLMATDVFRNPLPINLQEDFNPPTEALLYPSIINVDSITAPITELRVTLFGVYHTRPADMDVLVVSPTGRSVLVMSDAGGTADISGEEPINVVLVDNATRPLPQNTKIDAGVYRPTNYDFNDFYEDDELFNAPTHTTLADLAVGNPNGPWKLFLVDDTIGDIGGIGFGWGLTFVTGGPGPAAPSTPDMINASDRGDSPFDNITNVDTPRFSGTGTPGTQVRLFVDGVPDTNTVTVAANGTYLIQAQAIVHGTHTVSVRAINAQGTEGPSSGELTITIDTIPPEYPSAAPDLTAASDTGASSTDNDTNDTTPTFTGTAVGATTVQLLADDQVVGTTTVVNNTYTVTADQMEPGTYAFTVLFSDLAGNTIGPSDPLGVIIRPGGSNAPTVTAVYVRGSTWAGNDNNATNTTFKEYLEAKGLGDDVFGYRLFASGAPTPGPTNNPEQILPWINMDEIVLQYSFAPTGTSIPSPSTLTVNGQRNGAYTVSSVTPVAGDPTTYVLRLGKPLGGGDPVTNTTPTNTENGDIITVTVAGVISPGGGMNFSQRLNVLQGDVDHLNETIHNVLARDYAEVKKRFFKNTNTAPSNPDTDYSPFHDVDGSGQILATDYARVKSRFFQNLPSAAASTEATPFGATRIADEVLL